LEYEDNVNYKSTAAFPSPTKLYAQLGLPSTKKRGKINITVPEIRKTNTK